MKKKFLFSSLFVVAALVGCTNEEFSENGQNNDLGVDRPKVDLAFEVGGTDTKMEGIGTGIYYTTKDLVGAVLVDASNLWNVANGHVGNNRFHYDKNDGKFVTEGTTVVGSWLFYAQYDTDMTTTRGGVKFDFPQVQTYANDLSEIAKVKLEFPEKVDVQKLVLRPTTNALNVNSPFCSQYTIQNTSVPVADIAHRSPYESEQSVLNTAEQEMKLVGKYADVASSFRSYTTGTADQDIIALNCLEDKSQSNTFEGYVAIPAGEYANIAIYAYTDKGVFKYNVKNAYVESTDETIDKTQQENFVLRRGHIVELNQINREIPAKSYMQIGADNLMKYTDLQTTSETDGTVVISQEDLVAVINGINDSQEVKIRVLGDAVKINQDVMAALKAKLAVYPDAYLSFKDTDGQIDVVGNTASGTPLVLQNITFNGGAKLISGYASVSENISIPTMESFTVNAGSTLTFTTENGIYTGIENYGDVIFENTNDEVIIVPAIRKNLGTITINTPVKITTTLNNNMDVMAGLTGTIINNSTLDLNGTSTNNGMITNDGIINLTKDLTSNGEIVNNETINISSTLTNNGTITNNDGAILLVKGDGTAALNNEGVITNLGDMYCHEGYNTINNTGEIYAKAGSTTYITTNSKEDESTTATNNAINKMGEIFCDSRNVDVSVTKANQKGYISYNLPADKTELTVEPGDKFNKVYLNGDCVLNHESVNFVVVEAEANVTLGSQKNYQEFTFNKDAFVYSMPEYKNQIAQLVVAEGVRVKVPTENAIGVYGVRSTTTWTFAQIINKGTILVGGEFWSQLARPTTGTFASGDGQTSAFHWSETTWK